MKTQRLPPICPFGDSDDAAVLNLAGSRYHLLSLTQDAAYFIRIFTGDGGDVSYTIEDRGATEQGLLEFIHQREAEVTLEPEHREKLRQWAFGELLKALPR